MDWGSVALLFAIFAVGGFVMCVGAVTCVRWVVRRIRRKPTAVLYPPTFNTPARHTEPPAAPHTATPLRPDSGPRDWDQRIRP